MGLNSVNSLRGNHSSWILHQQITPPLAANVHREL